MSFSDPSAAFFTILGRDKNTKRKCHREDDLRKLSLILRDIKEEALLSKFLLNSFSSEKRTKKAEP